MNTHNLVHAFADTSFIGQVVAQKILEKYGVSLLFHKPTGTIEKCRSLPQAAGFEAIEIKSEHDSSYISLEKAKEMWSGNGLYPVSGQFPNPLSQLSSEQLAQARVEFDTALKALQTEQGIWA